MQRKTSKYNKKNKYEPEAFDNKKFVTIFALSLLKFISKCLGPLLSSAPLFFHTRYICAQSVFRLKTLIDAQFVPNDFILVDVQALIIYWFYQYLIKLRDTNQPMIYHFYAPEGHY